MGFESPNFIVLKEDKRRLPQTLNPSTLTEPTHQDRVPGSTPTLVLQPVPTSVGSELPRPPR